MMVLRREDGGSVVLVVALLLPLLAISLAGALELGALRVVALRVRAAADLATVVAIGDQDEEELRASGRFRPNGTAGEVARAFLALNLAPLAPSLAVPVAEIADEADVAVFPEPLTLDPRTGHRYERPAVRIAARVPVRTSLFAALLNRPVATVEIVAASVAR